MDLELIFSIVGMVTGGGGLVAIYQFGKKIGKEEEQKKLLEGRITSLEGEIAGLNGVLNNEKASHVACSNNKTQSILETKQSIQKDLDEFKEKIKKEAKENNDRIHERLDLIISDDSSDKISKQVEILIAGFQAHKAEWDTFKNDVRGLLKTETATTVEIANIKERLSNEEKRVAAHAEKLSANRADLDRLLRDSGRREKS